MSRPNSPFAAAATLGLFALLGLGLASRVHDLTQARIEANERAVLLRVVAALVPKNEFDNDILADTVTVTDPALGTDHPVMVYRARKQGEPVAAALSPIAPNGYHGSITLLVAIRADGTLAGVRVLEHRETPGLGDPIDADKSDWILGFEGRSLADPPENRWKVKKDGGDFDQFAGATVTPRAVVGAVRKALVFFEHNRARLFDGGSARPTRPGKGLE